MAVPSEVLHVISTLELIYCHREAPAQPSGGHLGMAVDWGGPLLDRPPGDATPGMGARSRSAVGLQAASRARRVQGGASPE